MAKKKLQELCNRLRVKWPDLHHICLQHRLGQVDPCQASVIIGISSAHRKSSLEALHFAIDDLKANVPIWKKEIYEDGSQWKENKECFFKKQEDYSESLVKVDASLVQVQASNDELNDRIDKFIEAKREEINNANILEFLGGGEKVDSCARTDAVLVKKKDTKSHLRKSSVSNPALEERLGNLEQCMNYQPVSKDVYDRLKALEDRLLLLERKSSSVMMDNVQADEPMMKAEENNADRKEELSQSLSSINNEISKLRQDLINS